MRVDVAASARKVVLAKLTRCALDAPVVRTTARTTNLLVILFGAGFSAMLVYALTSELFSKNSATVLYGQACELIKSSDKVRRGPVCALRL